MDLDQDGIVDILSGSATGQYYVFRGLGKGKFADKTPLLDLETGKEIRYGVLSNISTVDWDGDGKLDIVTYASCETELVRIWLGKGDLTYQAYKPLEIQGQRFTSQWPFHPETFPEDFLLDGRLYFTDWDRDGTPDLILGDGNGRIRFYRGSRGATKELSLAQSVVWVKPLAKMEDNQVLDYATMELATPRSGFCPTISAVDWNRDGKLDLLVGDRFMCPSRRQSLEEAAEEVALGKAVREAADRRRQISEEVSLELLTTQYGKAAAGDLSPEQFKEFRKEIARQLKEHAEYIETGRFYEEGSRRLLEYRIEPLKFGYVWVYLQK